MLLRTLIMSYSSLSQKIPKPPQIYFEIDAYKSVHLVVNDYIK